MRYLLPRLRRTCSIATLLLISVNGCSALMGQDAFAPKSVDQSEELAYTAPFKMKLVRVYWMNSGDSTGGKSLAVDLALTNYGDSPLKPTMPPMFELKDASGRHFAPHTPNDFTQGIILGGPINPGTASKGSVIFDVPPGSYDLYVYYGQFAGGWNLAKSGTAFVWALNPSQQ